MISFSELNRLLMVESAAKAAEKGKWSKKKPVCDLLSEHLHIFVWFSFVRSSFAHGLVAVLSLYVCGSFTECRSKYCRSSLHVLCRYDIAMVR